MAPIRWGIASAGKISNDFCAALTALPKENHQVVAAAARSETSAKEFAERFNIPKHYQGYDKLAADAEIDAVYIGVIHPGHLELGIMMLDAGKHVLCEKPLTMNEKHSKQLIEHAKEKKLLLVEAIWSRFFPSYRYLKSRLDANDLGDIKEVEVEFGFDLRAGEFGIKDRSMQKDLGAGTILDLGVYAIQISQFVFRSEPVSITAKGKLNEEGVDVEAEVEMKYENGGVAKFRTSALKELKNEAHIRGSTNSVTLHNFWSSTSLTDIDGSLKEWPLPKHEVGEFVFRNSAGLSYEAEEFRLHLENGLLESPFVTHAESLRIARIQDEIRRQLGVKYLQDE